MALPLRRSLPPPLAALLALALLGCPATAPVPDAGVPDAGDAGAAGDAGDAGPLDAGSCAPGPAACDGPATVVSCVANHPVRTGCPSGQSCLDGACAAACTDACNLGDLGAGPDGGALTCRLFDVAARAVVDAGPGMEDRARLYNSYLRKWSLAAGQVAQLEFTGPDLATLAAYNDTGDSAIFTGTYLAAEAWRYQATQSPDALAGTLSILQALHIAWNVAGSGSPGWLARFAAPASSPPLVLAAFSHSDKFDHFDGAYGGQVYDWKGSVSRDQYQGVLLGYSVAYDAVHDESVRELIRGDIVTFVTELMKNRTLCVVFNTSLPCVQVQTQYVVITDKEPLVVKVGPTADDTELSGALLFLPKPFGLYPDPTVAIQVAAAFEVGLQVTRGVPAWAAQYQAMKAFVDANFDSWMQVSQLWASVKNGCSSAYFGNNIAFEPMFDLARLEQDPARQAKIRSILTQNMWVNGLSKDKNSWFAYIFAANAAPADAAAAAQAVAIGNAQLAQFGPPPRAHLAVSNALPQAPNCPAYAADAIDIAHRVISDFDWQRDPRQQSDPGNPSEVYPGVDYLCAYWLGRQQGFLTNDAPTRCTRWLP